MKLLNCAVITAATLSMCAFTGSRADAALFDLTSGGTATLTNGFFTTTDSQSTGTGLIQSFVRIQQNGTEQGYNTDARPVQFQENTSPQFTRSLLLTAVPIVNIGGVDYREFLLDINQTNNNPLLALNDVQIWQRSAGNLTGFSGACTTTNCSGQGFASGTKVFGMDTAAVDNNLRLNYSLNNGSGSGDLFLYVLNSQFTGAGAYVYLYSRFGSPEATNDGFEEWAVRLPGPPGPCTFNCPGDVPEPASMLLLGLGLLGAGIARRRR